MDGVRVFHKSVGLTAEVNNIDLKLITSNSDLEVMIQTIPKASTAWVMPADKPEIIEFFYILHGSLAISNNDGSSTIVTQGDSFQAKDLKQDVMLTPIENTTVLYVTNSPMFEYLYGFSSDYNAVIRSINEKDRHTALHSKNVARICSFIAPEVMSLGITVNLDNLLTAAAFHDVGVCFLPDDIVTKLDTYNADDYYIMKRHALAGSNMLTKYNEETRRIVLCHHERLDGSGYPNGLKEKDIPIEAQIIAVADSFEAMVSYRPYKDKKTYFQAAQELMSMPKKYNAKISAIVIKLVENKVLHDGILEKYDDAYSDNR